MESLLYLPYAIWMLLHRFFNEKEKVREENKKFWTIAQWLSTGFLWHMWLSHDIANVFVYLPRNDVPLSMMLGVIGVLVIGLGSLFLQSRRKDPRNCPIQKWNSFYKIGLFDRSVLCAGIVVF